MLGIWETGAGGEINWVEQNRDPYRRRRKELSQDKPGRKALMAPKGGSV